MAQLTSEEKKLLKRLQQKSEAPDAPSVSRALNISIDLGDEKQVERAQKLGLLDAIMGDETEDEDEGADEDEDDAEDTPRRRGYFDKDA
jgi:hypothetical protein